jgi:preprotein translocase subunit SecD
MAAYLTTVVAMVPLFFAGAGLLKAFAITTIMGVTVGVLITRPAYAAIVEILLKEDD